MYYATFYSSGSPGEAMLPCGRRAHHIGCCSDGYVLEHCSAPVADEVQDNDVCDVVAFHFLSSDGHCEMLWPVEVVEGVD